MKLLVITGAFPPMRAGEADHMLQLCRRLAERGLDVHVITTRTNQAVNDLNFSVYPVIHDWSWLDIIRIGRFLKHIAPDAVLLKYIGWIYEYHPMVTFLPTVAKSIVPTVLFVTQFANAEGAVLERMSFFARLICKGIKQWVGRPNVDYNYGTLLRDSDRLIVYSDLHRIKLAQHLPAVNEKSILIPPPPLLVMSKEDPGSSRERGRERLGIKSDEILLICFGYVYPGKGVETLMKAFQTVARKHKRVRLLVLGGFIARKFPASPNFKDEISAMPRELGIEDRVIWFGEYAWDSDEASVCLRAADACVLPLDYGIQLNNSSFAAAISHGLPVITTCGVALEEPFVNEDNVLLCSPKDPAALARAIEHLMDNPELMERVKKGAQRLADKWFSWENAVDHTIMALGGLDREVHERQTVEDAASQVGHS